MGDVHEGIPIPDDDPFVIESDLARDWLRRDQRYKALLRPIITGDGVRRYGYGPARKFLILIPQGWTRSHTNAGRNPWQWFRHRYPLMARHLHRFEKILNNRVGSHSFWWETPCNGVWNEPRKKILFRTQFPRLAFLVDPGRGIGDPSVTAISSSSLYLAGLLNSRLMAFVFRNSRTTEGLFTWEDIRNLPVYMPDLDRPEGRAAYDRMETLVLRRIDLEKHCRAATSDPADEKLRQRIRTTDERIDALVYQLYMLTPDEIAVIESTPL
jgi:hypothetical protein